MGTKGKVADGIELYYEITKFLTIASSLEMGAEELGFKRQALRGEKIEETNRKLLICLGLKEEVLKYR